MLSVTTQDDEEIKLRSFDAMMANYLSLTEEEMQPGDSYLIFCFCRNAEEISEWWDSCLPDWPEDDPRWNTDEAAEFHGAQFHKGFRQLDVCSVDGDDSRIYKCLADGGDRVPEADTFWDIHAKTMRGVLTVPEL